MNSEQPEQIDSDMATNFAKANFAFASYASFRPVYPKRLYDRVLAYHGAKSPRKHCVDLGCGHGLVARELAPHFERVTGTDPSKGMITQAQSMTTKAEFPNLTFRESAAESLPFLEDGSVDLVVSGQAAHWFDYPRFFPEMRRVLRKGGTLALWGYKDPIFPDSRPASEILTDYSYTEHPDKMGPYWQRPGRTIVQHKYRAIVPPSDTFEDVERDEYEPGTTGPESGEGTMYLQRRTTVTGVREYVRTFSSFYGWQQVHPKATRRDQGGPGDLADELVDKIKQAEPAWQDDDFEVTLEWGSGLILARRK